MGSNQLEQILSESHSEVNSVIDILQQLRTEAQIGSVLDSEPIRSWIESNPGLVKDALDYVCVQGTLPSELGSADAVYELLGYIVMINPIVEHNQSAIEYIQKNFNCSIEGQQYQERFTRKLQFFMQLRLLEQWRIYDFSEELWGIVIEYIRSIYTAALAKKQGSVLLRTVISAICLRDHRGSQSNSNSLSRLGGNLFIITSELSDISDGKSAPGVYLINDYSLVQGTGLPALDSARRITRGDFYFGSSQDAYHSLPVEYTLELVQTMSDEVIHTLSDICRCDISKFSVTELFWILEYFKVMDARMLSQFHITCDQFREAGILEDWLRMAAICQEENGFDVMHTMEDMLYQMVDRGHLEQVQHIMREFTHQLDEVNRVAAQLAPKMLSLHAGDNRDSFQLSLRIRRRLLRNIHMMVAHVLQQSVGYVSSEKDLKTITAQSDTRIQIAKEITLNLTREHSTSVDDIRYIETLLGVSTADQKAIDLPESDKKLILDICYRDRLESLPADIAQRDTDNLAARLVDSATNIRVIRADDGTIISFACYNQMWDRPGYYVSGLTFDGQKVPTTLRAPLSVACYRTMFEYGDMYCAVYDTNSDALNLYTKRFNAVKVPELSSNGVSFLKLSPTNSEEYDRQSHSDAGLELKSQ